MRSTSHTGLFLILTTFMLFVSFVGGNLITEVNPEIISLGGEPIAGQATQIEKINVPSYATNVTGVADITWTENVFGWKIVPNITWNSDNPLTWVGKTVQFYYLMMTFSIPGGEAFSFLWWLLSAYWLWLLTSVIRGTG